MFCQDFKEKNDGIFKQNVSENRDMVTTKSNSQDSIFSILKFLTCLMGSGILYRQQACVRLTAVSSPILWPTDT